MSAPNNNTISTTGYTIAEPSANKAEASAKGILESAQDAAVSTPDEEEKKSPGQSLAEKLTFKTESVWEKSDAAYRQEAFDFAEGYKAFIDAGKTERECAAECVKTLESAGFVDIEKFLSLAEKDGAIDHPTQAETSIKPGMKVYQRVHGKAALFAVIGEDSLPGGLNVVGAHIDSPRLDVKTNPLYEDTGFAMLDTQYYGGVKKYQWVTIPLALHGVASRADGTLVNVTVGEDEGDPVFTITDLLPHLAREQMNKKADEFIPGEGLNALFGSIPFDDKKVKDKVKLNVLKLINDKYGMVEEDFTSAELELVPAWKSRDVGLDRGLVGGYGHDDRSCAYAALAAMVKIADSGVIPRRTCVGVLTDKEEIGSYGNTGADSSVFETFVAYLCRLGLGKAYGEIALRRCFAASNMLSTDVNSAVDPNWEGVQDKKTASYAGRGIVMTKYTGGRGKGGASDASAEFVGKVRRIFNAAGVRWQLGDLGKVDQGGGGTIAHYMAKLGMQVLDCGVPVLSMHAPFEVISKADLYSTYKGYKAFLENA